MKVICLLVLCALNMVNMKPVKPVSEELNEEDDDMDTGLEYDKYLRQVISVLEKDPEMRKKMEASNLEDLKSGKLALELDQMPGHFRSQLDELKRMEVQRLRAVAKQMVDKEAGIPGSNPKERFENLVGHVDPKSPDTFNERDLTNLLRKATSDLDAADKKRREEFKNYEMEKELQRRQKLKELDEQQRQTAEKEYQDQRNKLKEHDKLKHPGSKAQLEEVWEETDHLDKEDFNPRTFFALHDTNGDGNLDPFELEALFIKEVEKIYQDSQADPKEKFEELARMREHVLGEIDLDKNKLVSKEEFLKATDQSEFENDEGWDDLQQEEMFEEEELEGYEKTLREKELRRQKQREEFEVRKQKMQMEQDNFQKDMKEQQQAVNMEQVVLDQAAAQKKLTEMQQGNEQLKFNPADNTIDQKKQEQAQQPIVNQEALKLQEAAKINEGNHNQAEIPQANQVPPQQGNQIPQANQVPPQEGNEVQPPAGQPPQAGRQQQAGQQPPAVQQPQAGQPPQAGQQPQAGQPPQAGQQPPAVQQPQAGQPPQAGQQPPAVQQPQAGQPPQDPAAQK